MVIRAENVRRRYGSTVALDGVSLAVEAGEVFGLVGPNGAGKTTLVRALTGTTRADGDIEVFGHRPDVVPGERLGLLPQEFAPVDRLTARELLAYYAGLYDEARDPGAVLADVGLEDSADTSYERLSGGQKRRVCVGTALVNDPDLLVLDEPTTGVDPVGRRALWNLLEDLAERGRTVLLTTHDMAEAERLADRVGLLAEGRLVAVGSPAALVDRYAGGDRLVIDADDAGAAARALETAGYRVLPDERHLAVAVGPDEIPVVVDALAEAGVAYERLTWRQPSLEDVYLAVTDAVEAGDLGAGEAVRG
jgi:ABC-2 type transport system ATP-binding protein